MPVEDFICKGTPSTKFVRALPGVQLIATIESGQDAEIIGDGSQLYIISGGKVYPLSSAYVPIEFREAMHQNAAKDPSAIERVNGFRLQHRFAGLGDKAGSTIDVLAAENGIYFMKQIPGQGPSGPNYKIVASYKSN